MEVSKSVTLRWNMEYETSEPKTSTFDLYSKGVSSVE